MTRSHTDAPGRLLAALLALGTTLSLFSIGAAPASAIPCTGPTVATMGAADETYQADVAAKLRATCLFTQVDQINAFGHTPGLDELIGYDAVLVYSDYGFADNVAMGNVLADYVDGGGRVVVGALAFWTSDQPLGMGGRLSTGGYLPFTQAQQTAGGTLHLEADRPNSPYLANVGWFSGGEYAIQNNVSLASGSTQIAHWSSGAPLVAVKRRVVGLNFYPPSSDAASHFWDASTDGGILMANALLGGGVVIPRRQVETTVGNGLERQSKEISPGDPATFVFTITNRGNVHDRFAALGGTESGIVVRYVAGRTDVTDQVIAGTYVTTRRNPGRAEKIKLEVRVRPDGATGVTHEIGFVGTSVGDTSASDGAFAEIVV